MEGGLFHLRTLTVKRDHIGRTLLVFPQTAMIQFYGKDT